MDLYEYSRHNQIPPKCHYYIQHIHEWYDYSRLVGLFIRESVPDSMRRGVLEHILAKELFRVFSLPTVVRNPWLPIIERDSVMSYFDRLHQQLHHLVPEGMDAITSRWLRAPRHPLASEVVMWTSGLDLYMEYHLQPGRG